MKVGKIEGGEILKSDNISDYNDFDSPDKVKIENFKDAKIKNGILEVELPQASIITLKLA
ncbi:MAG: hypothetical protein J1D77_05970 [Muribaculaceae bacterium]|nr:hypothetical protein [Muribaculaceae bacterium]